MSKKFESRKIIGKKDGKNIYEYSYKRVIVALSPDEHKMWTSRYKNKGFDSITAMIRYSVNLLFDEIPNPEEIKSSKLITSNKLEKEIFDLKKNISEMRKEQRKSNQNFLSLNRQMLKLLANGRNHAETTKIATVQEKIYSLIKEKPRSFEEISAIIGIDDIETMKRLNALGKKDLIVFNKEEMEWRV